MANFKRHRCRYRPKKRRRGLSQTTFRAQHGLKPIIIPPDCDLRTIDWGDKHGGRKYNWGYPHWHDIFFHTRPRRRQETRCCRMAMKSADLEGLVWPLEKKPHKYYW